MSNKLVEDHIIDGILKASGVTNYKIFENTNIWWYNLCYMDNDWKGVWVHIEDIDWLTNHLKSQ